MSNRSLHIAAFGLAVLATVSTLGGLDAMADQQYRGAASAYEMLIRGLTRMPDRIVITGHRLQEVVIVGRRRG